MVRFADGPTAAVDVLVAAPPEAVWPLVSDIEIPARFSPELQKAVWQVPEGDDPLPRPGARFTGYNTHPARGEWQTTNVITACEPPRVFAWAVGEDPSFPSATWCYELEPEGAGTRLRFTARMGPGPSGMTAIIAQMHDKEEKIIARRLEEWTANMTATIQGIKGLAEAGA